MTPAVVAATRAGIAFDVLEYDPTGHDEGYGVAAAQALGLAPERVFKTLVIELVTKRLAVAIIPVAGRLDLKAAAAALGSKRAVMAEPAAAERATGYVLGGISPLGQKRRLAFAIDSSAVEFDRIHVSGGRRGLEIGLAPLDLARLVDATVAPITR